MTTKYVIKSDNYCTILRVQLLLKQRNDTNIALQSQLKDETRVKLVMLREDILEMLEIDESIL